MNISTSINTSAVMAAIKKARPSPKETERALGRAAEEHVLDMVDRVDGGVEERRGGRQLALLGLRVDLFDPNRWFHNRGVSRRFPSLEIAVCCVGRRCRVAGAILFGDWAFDRFQILDRRTQRVQLVGRPIVVRRRGRCIAN